MTEPKKERLSPKKVQEDLTNKLDRIVASTNDAIEETNSRIEDLGSKMDKVLNAIDQPAFIRSHFDAGDQDLGEDHVLEAESIDGNSVIETPKNVNPDSPEFKDKAAELAFMEEPVTVHILDTSEKNADKVFDISVNGRARTFMRNEEYTIPRKYVEGLARAKPVHYDNEEYTKSNGERSVRWPSRKGLRYQFSVLRDDNPRGKEWLRNLLRQP